MITTQIEKCTIANFYQILTDITNYLGSARRQNSHNPVFIYEFGDSVYVIKGDSGVMAYLSGFIA